jgi:hypothetical protein
MLTKAQLEKIETLIRQRFLGFTYEALGERALTREELEELKRAGLLRGNVRNLVAEGYTLGKVVASLEDEAGRSLTYEQAKRAALKMTPMTEVEKRSIEWAQDHAGQYIKGLSDDMVKEVRASAARTASSAIRAVQDKIAEAIRDRKTVSELRTSLFDAIDDRARDWQRVAFTEMNESIQRGIYQEIRRNSPVGSDQLVFKRPNPDACKHCKRVYLEDDGVTPKVFRLSELEDNNYGKKAADWGPTIGSVHPWCQCQLQVVPEGYGFVKNEAGEAILEFTGTTASPSTRKSVVNEPLSDTDDDCTCSY